MHATGFDCVDAIAEHSAGFAQAAAGNPDAEVEHCPGWTVLDLVQHLIEVQWFWATISEHRLAVPPDASERPAAAPREALVETFRAGAQHLCAVLRAADSDQPVWTWARAQQDIAFIRRHQVQEAAVHHWDAVHAAGGSLEISPPVAADAIAEFLTFSVSSPADPATPQRPDLDGRFTLRCSDAPLAWAISGAQKPGTVRAEIASSQDPRERAITATASDLLLWLYHRVELDTSAVSADLIGRFRALCLTD